MRAVLKIQKRPFFLILLSLAISCQNTDLDSKGHIAHVHSPAGSIDPDFNPNFLPLPFNLATIEGDSTDIPTIIISEQLKQSTSAKVRPLGTITVKSEGKEQSFIIAVLSNSSNSTISVESFTDLITEQSHLKSTIDHYLEQKSGMESYTSIKWSDQFNLHQ